MKLQERQNFGEIQFPSYSVKPTAYSIRNVNSEWKVPQEQGFLIKTNKDGKDERFLGIKEEKDGGKVAPEAEETDGPTKDKTQLWNVDTVVIDSKTYHIFSINDFVLTGKWKINVQGNLSAVTIVGCIMCIATYFKTGEI